MKHTIQTLAFFLLVLFSTKGFSQVSFAPYDAHSIGGSWPWVVAIADLNNDGLNDVVMGTQSYGGSSYDYSLLVYLQNSSGSLNAPIQYKYPPVGTLRGIAVGDVNNDGLADVVIGYNDSIRIFYQLSNGTLGNSISFYSGNTVDGVKIGDINNDRLNDIVVSHWNDAFIRVFIQGAGGSFTQTTYPSLQAGYDEIDIGDVNNDGLNDVVLMSGQSWGGFHVYTQTKYGTLNGAVDYGVSNTNFYGLAIGDLNDDGRNDVVTTIALNSPNAALNLWFQDTTNHLLQRPPVSIPSLDIPEPVLIDKLGCDGKNQIIVAHGGWNKMTVFSQDTSNKYGTYQSFPLPYASHYSPEGMAVGDINNDGKDDVVIADYNNGLIVLLNTTSSGGGTASVNISAPTTSICTGTPVNFTATTTNGGTSPTYLWEINNSGAGTNDSVFNTSSLSNNDTVKCIMTSNAACVSGSPATSNAIIMTVGNKDIVGIITESRDTICPNLSVNFTDQGGSGTPIQWQSSNTPGSFSNITGADSSFYQTQPLTTTTYYRLIVGSGKCADTSTVRTLLVLPEPATNFNTSVNGLQVTFSLLDTAGDITEYFWNFGDGMTSSQANPVHTFNADTTYDVCLTVYNGSNCSYTYCADVNLKANGIPNITGSYKYSIYPNPFNDFIFINHQSTDGEIKSVKLFDVTGREIYSYLSDKEVNNNLKISLPGLAQGIYYLKIQADNANYIQPVVKQ